MPQGAIVVIIVVAVIFFLVIIGLIYNFIGLYVQAMLSGAPIGMFDLLAMKLRRVPLQLIVMARITSKKAGMDVPTDKWEAHYLARGKVEELLRAMVTAHQGGLEVSDILEDGPPSDAAKKKRDVAMFDALAGRNFCVAAKEFNGCCLGWKRDRIQRRNRSHHAPEHIINTFTDLIVRIRCRFQLSPKPGKPIAAIHRHAVNTIISINHLMIQNIGCDNRKYVVRRIIGNRCHSS